MSSTEIFQPSKISTQLKRQRRNRGGWQINARSKTYKWATQMERVDLIRNRLPVETLEVVARQAGVPIQQVLELIGIHKTTYNKKKRAPELLSSRDSEMVLILIELLTFGKSVFNDDEKKFQRWLKKNNISLGGVTPVSLFDSVTGIAEVKNALLRLEYGNLA
ncbi:putative toxin-antitoxin system antitoxin component, TIGR02293 family [Cyclonatronum proteinivorum]|uniref:Putative toxin-antitoxin system antitoxin component, TIGR02293 family n=1 Tax=Cyclonatronum proteinivorum TaxID=1457365 RepID=A0A345UNR0_9BACT|nr:antitoxin Xre/MbcA/ParS toxin-binding domain-containing protein [Cyclonatronum proteinivorum]AXJ02112.1 putative toxin-antitoxin system antitoxin component, TIGR02293 family [Cyclonatronum proteinivorum]